MPRSDHTQDTPCLGPRARPSARAPRARRGEAWPRPTPGAAARLGRSGLGQGSGIAPPHHTNRARLTPSDRATLLSPGAQGVFFFAVRRSISRDCRGRPPSGACIPGTWRRSLARQYCKHRWQRGCRYPGAQFRLFHPSSLLGPPTVGQRGVGWLGQNLQASGQAGRLPYVRGSGRTASPGMAVDRFTVCVIISSIISTISLIEKRCEPPTSCARRASGAAAGVC